MTNLFTNVRRESAVDVVVNSIRQLLMERKLVPGDRLPSEYEISEGLGVSRGSVREAMKILSAFGIVDVQVGNGTFVSEHPGHGALDLMFLGFLLSESDAKSVYEFRQLFETDIIRLAIRHYEENEEERKALAENLTELEQILADREAGEERAKRLNENDIDFHRTLGRASKNELSSSLYELIIEFLSYSISSSHRNQDGSYIRKAHGMVVKAIEDRDEEAAAAAAKFTADTWLSLQKEE